MQQPSRAYFKHSSYSPAAEDNYTQQQPVNLKDFETFEPRESQLHEENSQASSLLPHETRRRLADDMHLELDDLDVPNNSMTMSSLSQSQWQGRSGRSYLSNISQLPLGQNTHQSSLESSQLPSGRQQDSNSNLTMSNSHSHQFGTEEKSRHHEDSPDFNRPQESLVSVTDELTVSKSDLGTSDLGGKSWRGDLNDQPILRNQNRTFADSVMDSHLRGVKSQNQYTSMKQLKQADSHLQPKNLAPYLEDQLSDSISDLDLLTKTQISANQFKDLGVDPNARSHIMIPQLLNESLTHSQITSNEAPQTKRTTQNNLFKNLLRDEFTPEKNSEDTSSNSINWQLKSQPQLAAVVQEPVNPIMQLKERIKQSNIQKRRDSSRQSKQDQELYEALEAQPEPRKIQQIQPSVLLQSNQSQNTRVQELEEQNRHLAKSCQVLNQQLQEALQKAQQKPADKQELLRVRALEATRSELKETQKLLEEKDQHLHQLQNQLSAAENQIKLLNEEKSQLKEQFDLQLDKQKILMQGQKRENQSSLSQQQKELQQALERCVQLDQIRQEQQEQIQQNQKRAQLKVQSMQESLHLRDSELKSLEQRLDQLQRENSQLEAQKHGAQTELLDWKTKCEHNQEELDELRSQRVATNTFTLGKNNQEQGFDSELRRVKEKHQKDMAKIQEQLFRTTTLLNDKDVQIQILQQKLMTPAKDLSPIQTMDTKNKEIVAALVDFCQCSDQELLPLYSKLKEENLSLQKEGDELRLEISTIKQKYAQAGENISELKSDLLTITQKLSETERQLSQRDQPSNYTKNLLLQKDIDISNLQGQLESVQEQKWQVDQTLLASQTKIEMLEKDKLQLQQEIAQQRRLRQDLDQEYQQYRQKQRQPTEKETQVQLPFRFRQFMKAVFGCSLDEQESVQAIESYLSSSVEDQANKCMQTIHSLNEELEESKKVMLKTIADHNEQSEKVDKEHASHISKLREQKEQVEIEVSNLQQACERQQSIIQQLEKQVLGKDSKQNHSDFLEVFDGLIEGTYQEQNELALQLKQRIRILQRQESDKSHDEDNDISQITNEANPLQDKSGKHEAMMFLSHLQNSQTHQKQQKETQTEDKSFLNRFEEHRDLVEHLQQELTQKQNQFDLLNQQLMSELQLKSDELDIETQNITTERMNHLKQLAQVRKEVEQQYQKEIKELQEQNDFKIQELEISFQRKLEENMQESMTERSQQSQKQSHQKEKFDQQLSQARLQIKEAKSELDRIKKLHSDKVAKMQEEHSQAIETLQQQHLDLVQENWKSQQQKQKQVVEQAVQKVKSELMNKMTEQKNDYLKKEAEWQRQQSKFNTLIDDKLEEQKTLIEQEHQKDLTNAKQIVERMWKKKTDDLQKKHQQEIQDLEEQLEETTLKQREELRKQSKQWQQKLKDLQQKYQQEEMSLLEKTDCMDLIPIKKQTSDQECQYSPKKRLECEQSVVVTPEIQSKKAADLPLQQSAQTHLSAKQQICGQCNEMQKTLTQQNMFIDQLKLNFEAELGRQEQKYTSQQLKQVQLAIKSLENLYQMELQKILITLQSKQELNQTEAQKTLQLKRTQINTTIKEVFSRHQKTGEYKQLKQAFETVKEKFTFVLSTLKNQLDQKYQSKLQQAGLYATNATTIQIEDTQNEIEMSSTQKQTVSKSHENQKIFSSLQRQSQDSTEVNLIARSQESVMQSPPISQRRFEVEPLNKYISEQSPTVSQDQTLNRVAPQQLNNRGNVVVEVERVCRDIQMLYETTKMAKFCRLLIGQPQLDDQSILQSLNSARSDRQNQQQYVTAYRDLLNNFFKLVSKLNNASDQLCQDKEVFRLRLLNVDLQQQVSTLQKEHSGVVTRQLVQDVLCHYQKHSNSTQVKQVLDALEQLHFQISKNQFKLNQLADLFTDSDGRVNLKTHEVVRKCEQFNETMDSFLESAFPDSARQRHSYAVSAEMMSPNETAQLIATVLQKLPHSQKSLSQSSEEILVQALQLCNQESSIQQANEIKMPPLLGLRQQQQQQSSTILSQQPISTISRSRSSGQVNNMPRQMTDTTSFYHTVDNQSISSSTQQQQQQMQKPKLKPVASFQRKKQSERYPPSKQLQSITPQSRAEELDSSNEFNQIDEQDYLTTTTPLEQELDSAQSNVNNLFEKVQKSRFNTLQY